METCGVIARQSGLAVLSQVGRTRGLRQTGPHGVGDRRGPAAYVQLAEDVVDMGGGGSWADVQSIRDLPRRVPERQQAQNLELTGGEAVRNA